MLRVVLDWLRTIWWSSEIREFPEKPAADTFKMGRNCGDGAFNRKPSCGVYQAFALHIHKNAVALEKISAYKWLADASRKKRVA